MSRNLVRPYFPVPPQDYTQGYMSEVLRSFSVFLEQNQNLGALFEHNGYVKITKSNVPHVGSVSGTGGVGTVTVTTS